MIPFPCCNDTGSLQYVTVPFHHCRRWSPAPKTVSRRSLKGSTAAPRPPAGGETGGGLV